MTYHVLTASRRGTLITLLVSDDDLGDCDGSVEDFFLSTDTEISRHGTVEITGINEHMVPGVLTDDGV